MGSGAGSRGVPFTVLGNPNLNAKIAPRQPGGEADAGRMLDGGRGPPGAISLSYEVDQERTDRKRCRADQRQRRGVQGHYRGRPSH